MKRLGVFMILFFIGISLYAQEYRKTSFEAPLTTVVQFNDPNIKNYDPVVVHLDQHPVPYFSEMFEKKKAANARRISQPNFQALNKTRGESTKPVADTGWAANSTSSVPMDNDIAVSNAGIVISAVNSSLYIYDTLGKRLGIRGLLSLDTLLTQFSRASDPRLLYDPNSDRFILVFFSGSTSTTSNILVGFTAGNDPLGDWNFYAINGNPNGGAKWSDYPIIAHNKEDLYNEEETIDIDHREVKETKVLKQTEPVENAEKKPEKVEI